MALDYLLRVEATSARRSMSAFSTNEEDRRASRRRVLKSGVIAYRGRHVTQTCIVRDVSRGGARLQVASSIGIPDDFELLIELDCSEASCRVIWRRSTELG